jgi:hypothetical protein
MADLLQDQLLIRELTANYAAAASLMSVDGLAACFTDDVVYQGVLEQMGGSGDLVGARTVAEYMGSLWANLQSVTQVSHPGNIRVAGNTATQTCDIVEYVKRPNTPGFTIVVGHYDDQLTRSAAGWRFKHRKLSFRIFQHIAEAQP